jgi:hypothetical protein
MHFQQTEKMLTNILYDSGMEQKILKHWRTYEPKLVEDLVWKQMLKKTLTQKASDLIDLQMSLEKTEELPPVLAAMEAWNRLMKPLSPEPEELDAEEEASWSEMDI